MSLEMKTLVINNKEYEVVDEKARPVKNVAEMKALENLEAGNVIKTIGYYQVNDGGGATYLIREKTEADVDDGGSIHFINESLVAEMIAQNGFVNIKQFGAKGDGVTDDTEKINNALLKFKNVYFNSGTYMIDALTYINVQDDSHLILDKNCILQAITNDAKKYRVISISGKHNVVIEGGTIKGERDTHNGTEGEWGNGIEICHNSSNITIKNIVLRDCWGDGLFIYEANNITTENIVCDNNRRQGMSICGVSNYHSINDKFINTNGKAPECGVDIEPIYETDIIENVVFDNPYTENNNKAGLMFFFNRSFNMYGSIIVNNHVDKESHQGIVVAKGKDFKGTITVNNGHYIKNKIEAIELRDCFAGPCKVIFNNPIIENCNTSLNTENEHCGAIVSGSSRSDATNCGSFYIFNPKVTITENPADSFKYLMSLGWMENSAKYEDIKIINPITNQEKMCVRITVLNCGDIEIVDNNEVMDANLNSNFNITAFSLRKKYIFENLYANTEFSFGSGLPIKTEIDLINRDNTYPVLLKIPTGNYCRMYSNTEAPTIKLQPNSVIKIKKINSTDWEVTKVIGNVFV